MSLMSDNAVHQESTQKDAKRRLPEMHLDIDLPLISKRRGSQCNLVVSDADLLLYR